jgi:hypothetical protein
MDEFYKILLTFALTTVDGGLLGYVFQARAWKHQNHAKLLESERATATKIFEEISRLMDKRLYRMKQLYWKLNIEHITDEILEEQMKSYREVLFEWNDNLNRNLALTQAYFGKGARKKLEGTIYEEFRRIGSQLENLYKERKTGGKANKPASLGKEFGALNIQTYKLNLEMISLIQNQTVGFFNPDTKQEHEGKAQKSKPVER